MYIKKQRVLSHLYYVHFADNKYTYDCSLDYIDTLWIRYGYELFERLQSRFDRNKDV